MPFITDLARQEFREFMVSSPLKTAANSLGDCNLSVSADPGRGQSTIDPILRTVIDLRVLNGLVGDVADFGREKHVAEVLATANELRSRVHEMGKAAQSIEKTMNDVIRLCQRGLASPL